MTSEEIKRLNNNNAGETTAGPSYTYEIQPEGDVSECLSRIKLIVQLIAAQSREAWPTEATGRALLPSWFINDSFTFFTTEEAQFFVMTTPKGKWAELAWNFDGWLEAIRDRGWAWWSSRVRGDGKAEICLSLGEWPASLEAFEQIVRAIGAKLTSITK